MKYLDRLRESFHTGFECFNPTLSTLRVLGFTQHQRGIFGINGLSSVDKKGLETTLMGLALIEDEQHEKSLRTNSKPGKSAPKGANGGGGAFRRRSHLREHSRVQTRVLKLHPKVIVVGMSV